MKVCRVPFTEKKSQKKRWAFNAHLSVLQAHCPAFARRNSNQNLIKHDPRGHQQKIMRMPAYRRKILLLCQLRIQINHYLFPTWIENKQQIVLLKKTIPLRSHSLCENHRSMVCGWMRHNGTMLPFHLGLSLPFLQPSPLHRL